MMTDDFKYITELLSSHQGMLFFHIYDNSKGESIQVLTDMDKYRFKTHKINDYAIVLYYLYDPEINIMAGEYTSSSAQRVQMLKKVSGITIDVTEPVKRSMVINIEVVV